LLGQAAEQLVRAIATSEDIHIPRADSHQLDKIVRQIPKENPFTDAMNSVIWLEAYATTFRYPTSTGRIPAAPDPVKLKRAAEQIKAILEDLCLAFGFDFDDTPASGVRKPQPIRRPPPVNKSS